MTNTVTVSEAARRLKVSPRTIQRWIDAGFFPGAYKNNPMLPNSPYQIPETALQAFIAGRK